MPTAVEDVLEISLPARRILADKLPDSVVLAASISSFKRRLSSFVVSYVLSFIALTNIVLFYGHLLAEVASSLAVFIGIAFLDK